MKRRISLVTTSLVLAIAVSTGRAANWYFDQNDDALGSGVAGLAYNWTTDGSGGNPGFWNTNNADGTQATSGLNTSSWVNGNDAVFSAGTDADGIEYAVVVGSGVTSNSVLVENGTVKVNGGVFDTGASTVTVTNGATLKINGTSSLSLTTGKVVLNNGTLQNYIAGSGGSLIGGGANTTTGDGGGLKPLEINGIGYVGYDNGDGIPDNVVTIMSGVILGTGGTTTNGGAGTLVKIGPDQLGIGVTDQDFTAGALRIHSQSLFTFAKLVVKQGGYRLRNGTQDGTVRETAFGAVPLTELADAITLDGGGIGTNATVTLHANRGITVNNSAGNNLGVIAGDSTLGGGYFDHGATAGLNIPGPLSGSGSLYIGDPTSAATNAVTFTLSHANNVNTFNGNLIGVRSTLQLNSSLKVNGLKDVAGFTQNAANNATITIATGNTLTVGVSDGGGTWSRAIGGAGGFTKMGSGTETLTAANTYSGNTTVQGGTLSISNAYLANAADVLLSTGSIFDLNTAGATDVIHSLFIDNVLQAAGVWGSLTSGAAHTTALITGSGFLNATVGAVTCAPGDLNCDGHVDAGDYAFWRKNGGTPNDANYTAWRSNFGVPAGAGSGLSGGGAVPEPTTIGLVLVGLAAFGLGRRSRVA